MRSLVLVALVACSAAADPARPLSPPDPPRRDPNLKPEPGVAPASPELRVKNLVDRYRAAVGLPAVTLDPVLSKGCMEHAEYMRLNKDGEAMRGLNAHQQRPSLPGATPEGAKCGKAADLFPGVSDLEVAVDGWMAGLYHRRPILDPTLAKIGVGYSKLPDGSYMAALMFVDGKDNASADKWPVAYPADKQGDIPLDFGNEVPNPVPGGGRAGYPITIQFPAFDKVTGVTAKLDMVAAGSGGGAGAGKPVPFHLSDPEHPATSFGQYGVVCLIPKLPLQPRTTYRASVTATWKGTTKTHSWAFTTLSLRAVDAHDEAAVVKSLNIASTLKGTVLHGGMMDSDTAFLQIGERQLKNYKMISVLIPLATWRELGGKPERFVGKTIEVDGTPHLVQGVYINVQITVASQLRIVR
ncbi:MAG: CAP domain-containing protein [Deltaproteobacteria bacterium]|nr:CAP domain-containing protein [Deltaproteobacteria bacterium]